MQTLATLFIYFVIFAVLAGTADMTMLELMLTSLLGLSVGTGAQWVAENK